MAIRSGVRFDAVILPTDLTDISGRAVPYALSLARQHRARLVVTHVVDLKGEAAGFYLPHISFEKLDCELLNAAGEKLARFRERLAGGYGNTEERLLSGRPFEEILRITREYKAPVIVMATSAGAAVDRFFFGSTAGKVVRGARCPVLVVPPSE